NPTAKPPVVSVPAGARKSIPNPAKNKAILGCLGAFGAVLMIFLFLAFIFLAQSSADTVNPIAALLGINQPTFVNGLITFVHIIFLLIALVTFTFTMIGLFRASMAKKDDKVAKKAALRTSVFSGVSLLVVLFIWMGAYIYLDSKRIDIGPGLLEPIVTVPADTTLLTAPIEIKFDASNVPVDTKNFQIISFDWDFGDSESGTNQIVSHIYKDKGRGRYDVVLTVTRRDRKSGEEFQDMYTRIVSISNEALAAVFSADPQSGEAPLEVKFDASASADPDGVITAYEWDLDEDGQFDDAKGATVTNTFDKIGRYTVALRVTSTTGEFETAEKEIIVEEKVGPAAVIKINDDPGKYLVGESYIFRGSESTSKDGDITKYEWDFGDGTKPANTATVSHSFSKPGNYTLTLRVTDSKDNDGETTLSFKVETPQGTPVAAIGMTPQLAKEGDTHIGKVPLTVDFDASKSTDSDSNIIDYKWDFNGDDITDAAGKTATYTFSSVGTYNVTLTVTDATGNSGLATVKIEAQPQGIVAKLTADKIDGSAPLTVNFDASGSTYQNGTITSYRWDFGDDSPIKLGSSAISHRYAAIGTFTVSVTAIGSDSSQDTASLTVTVREVPLAACFTSVFTSGKAPLSTTFDPSCSTGSVNKYFWDFGDGATSTSVKPTHSFTSAGTYAVELEVSDADNTVSTKQMTITVTE
ncbi:MAG: PKD domain-containing protein, partial [Candidatus Gracilibacteria bacterium]